MSKFFLKKFTIVSFSLSIFAIYFTIRMKSIPRKYVPHDIYPYYRPTDYSHVELFRKCKNVYGIRYISYNESDILASVSYFIDKVRANTPKYSSDNNFFHSSELNFCLEDSSDCVRVDQRVFFPKYFKEIVKEEQGMFEFNKLLKKYRLKKDPDSDYSIEEQTLRKGFGFIMMLAYASEMYIDTDFTKSTLHFLLNIEYNYANVCNSLLDTELEGLDLHQYNQYRSIKNSSYSWEQFKFFPDSSTPFDNLSWPRPSYELYYYYTYPFNMAAENIFRIPYSRSINSQIEGKNLFYDMINLRSQFYIIPQFSYENLHEVLFGPVRTTLSYSNRSYYQSYVTGNDVCVFDWKKYSEVDGSVSHFWKALMRLNSDDIDLFFRKVSGWTHVPNGGFARAPTTRIIGNPSCNEITVIAPFVIQVPTGKSRAETIALLRKFVNA